MFTIRTYNRIASKGLALFGEAGYRLGKDLEQPDAFLLRSQKLHGEPLPETLLAIARAGAGVNNIPLEDCSRAGVVVFNTPGANANAVKELVAAGLLLASRDIVGGIGFVQSLSGMEDQAAMSRLLEAEKKRFAGSEIAGKTLGVVGLGAIGSMVANLALELGMQVAGFDPAISIDAAWRLSSRVKKMESLEALVGVSDYLTLHIPANQHTRGLLNEAIFDASRPGLRLLNFARDEVVDRAAVLSAMDRGQVSRYVTDFPHPDLSGRPEVLALPHIGASTAEAEENCALMAATQLKDFLENGNIHNSVNFPPTRMGRNGGHRLTICNKNIPRVLGSVLSVLADRDINVIDMVNKSRGEVAYNIIDVESLPGPQALDEIQAAEGVIRVRLL